MLRQLDGGWAIFRFPIYPQWDDQYLGQARAGRSFPAGQSRACTVDHRAVELQYAGAELGWQMAFRRGRTTTRRTCSLQYEDAAVGQLSVRNIGAVPGFFQGWSVAGLCDLPGGRFVAEQSRWQGVAPTHLPTDASQLAALVSRWETDRFLGQGAWQTLEGLFDFG